MKTAKDILYFFTGWAIYAIVGLPITATINYFCPPSHHSAGCDYFFVAFLIVCVLAFPFAVKGFCKAGKWFWTELLPHIWAVAR